MSLIQIGLAPQAYSCQSVFIFSSNGHVRFRNRETSHNGTHQQTEHSSILQMVDVKNRKVNDAAAE